MVPLALPARPRGEAFDRTCALAVLVSALALPYGWHFDQATMLPIYLWLWSLAVWPREARRARGCRAAIILGLVAFEVGEMAMVVMRTPERYFVVWPWVLAGLVGVAAREGGSAGAPPSPGGHQPD